MTEDKKYTEKELVEFANYILENYDANPDGVNHASLENWKGSKQIIIPRENCNLIIDSDTIKEVKFEIEVDEDFKIGDSVTLKSGISRPFVNGRLEYEGKTIYTDSEGIVIDILKDITAFI